MKLEIYSSLGELISQKNVLAGSLVIDLSNQPKGIYFLKINSKNKIEQRKLIIQ